MEEKANDLQEGDERLGPANRVTETEEDLFKWKKQRQAKKNGNR